MWNHQVVGCQPKEFPVIWLKEQLHCEWSLLFAGMALSMGQRMFDVKTGLGLTTGIALRAMAIVLPQQSLLGRPPVVQDTRTHIRALKNTPLSGLSKLKALVVAGIGYSLGLCFNNRLPFVSLVSAFCYGLGVLHLWDPLLISRHQTPDRSSAHSPIR